MKDILVIYPEKVEPNAIELMENCKGVGVEAVCLLGLEKVEDIKRTLVKAEAEYVLVYNENFIYDPNSLKDMSDALDENRGFDFFKSSFVVINSKSEVIEKPKGVCLRETSTLGTCLFRKSVFVDMLDAQFLDNILSREATDYDKKLSDKKGCTSNKAYCALLIEG